jgi:hypothetical protein
MKQNEREGRNNVDSRMEHFKDVIKIRFPDFDLSSLDWEDLDEFYKDHPEEIPIENEFVGYRSDGDVIEDFNGNLYLIPCDPGIHPIGSSVMRQSELDGAVKLGKRISYVDELLDHAPESSPYTED